MLSNFCLSYGKAASSRRTPKTLFIAALCCIPLFLSLPLTSTAGVSEKLPSADKLVAEYIKTAGGRKRLAAIRDATYDWDVQRNNQPVGSSRIQLKAPDLLREDLTLSSGITSRGVNGRSAWERTPDGAQRTITGLESGVARLQALLEASHFIDYSRNQVLARTAGMEQSPDGSEPLYKIEFSTRAGARLACWFGATTHLPWKYADLASGQVTRLGEFRPEQGVMEPHRLEIETPGAPPTVYLLRGVSYNAGLAEAIFDSPRSAGDLDIPALLLEVARHQKQLDERIGDYTYTQRRISREMNARGEVTKETVKVYEVYPVPGHRPVFKLVSENGVPVPEDRAAKEQKRAGEDLERATRERAKEVEEREARRREREKRGEPAEDDERKQPGIAQFLRASEFIAPRRERLGDRDTIVFDFRPRPGFHAASREEEIINKLTGIIWIDPVDKQVVRLEARFTGAYKVGGGLLASVRPGTAIVIEQTRLPDGVWLPRFSQFNASVKVLMFKGIEINETREFSDYHRFRSEASGYKLETPKPAPSPQPQI